MFKIWKYRRGQVRGIDFSLAMIIFLLTMSQILVLTTTFIESSRTFQGTNQLIEDTNTLAMDMLTNPGGNSTSTKWESSETTSLGPNWRFGLANNNSEINSFKLGRLANNSLSNYLLNYSRIVTGLHDNTTFKIEITTPLRVNLTSVIDTGSSIQVTGLVSFGGSPVSNAKIWIFIYTSDNEVVETQLETNSIGNFSQNIIPTTYGTSDFFAVTVISKVGIASEAIDFKIIPKTGTSSTKVMNTQSILPDYSSTSGNQIIIRSAKNQNNPNQVQHIAFYASSGIKNFTQITNQGTVLNQPYWQEEIGLPVNGIVGILTLEVDGGTHYFSYTVFPLIMDNVLHDDIGPAIEPNSETIKISQLINVRNVYLEFKLTTWRSN